MAIKKKKKEVKAKYTLGEEIVNSISHGIGAGLAIAGLVLICCLAHSAIGVVSGVIYASLMIILFTISCVYHSLSPRLTGKKVLRVIDHCDVLLMVAGTYTPICLSLIGGKLGWIVFSIVWAITIIAIVFNCLNLEKYKYVCLACNLIVGWSALIIIKQLLSLCPRTGIVLLIAGGIVYSIGAILYAVGHKVRYVHSVFHFFVLGGAVLHYFLILFYVV